MKTLFTLLIVGTLGYGIYYGYENCYDKKTGEVVMPWQSEDANEVTKEFEVETRQWVVVDGYGKKFYKTYKETAAYSYPKNASVKEKMLSKKAVRDEVMKKLISKAKADREQISQCLAYYKDVDKQLGKITGISSTLIDPKLTQLAKELRKDIRTACNKCRMLTKELELKKEDGLDKVSRLLIKLTKSKQQKKTALNYDKWYQNRFDKYPEVDNLINSYKGIRRRR